MAFTHRWLPLLVTTLALAGCSPSPSLSDAGSVLRDDAGAPDAGDVPAERPDAGTGAPDAGPPASWDGGAQTLPEFTDLRDRGPHSACGFTLEPGTPVASCDDLSLFDLRSCTAGAFDGLDSVGFYQVEARPSTNAAVVYPVPYSLRLPLDGGAGYLTKNALTRQEVGAGAFTFASTLPATRFTPERHLVFTGCTRPTPDRINGCYVDCAQGKVRTRGTFTAIRPGVRARGESESSGLSLVSESFVATGVPVDVYVAKDHAYVVSINEGDKRGGLSVFDVRDRAHPVLTKTVQLPNDTAWNGVWAKGDALYLASASSGVIVYDISRPAEPQYVRAVPGEPLNVHTVHVQGDRLYAMAPGPFEAVLVFDVASPLAPVELHRLSLSAGGSGPHDAFAYEDRLYVSYTEAGYVAFDVRDAANAPPLGAYAFDGQYAHASAVGTVAGRTVAFEGGEFAGSHLRVLDVTDPADMRLIGEYQLRPELSIHNLVLKGTRLYVAYYHEGVRVLDVSVPPRPREIAWFNTYRETDPGREGGLFDGAIGIRVPGDGYVYVVDTARGLLILREP